MRLPKAFPDESLYSRICRHLATSGLTKSQYLNIILGDSRASIHPYLNANLSAFCNLLNEPIQKVWKNQTLAPLFAYYLPSYRHVISDPSISPNCLIRACQISAFREKERLCVKLCYKCVAEEISEYGVPYWHCLHQVSGLEVCSRHGVWLTHIALPERSHIMLPPVDLVQSEHCSGVAVKFANYCKEHLRKIRANESNFSSAIRLDKLKEKGFITCSGQVRRRQICGELYVITEQVLPPDSIFHPRSEQDFSYWSSVLSGTMNQPPFKQLILNFFLEDIADDAQSNYEPKLTNFNYLVEERCCNLLSKGCSMAEVGRQIGKSRCYVKGIALKHQIPVNLRPKVLTEALKQDVIDLARKGFHRKAIATKHRISSGSVEQIISTVKGLVKWRKRCKFESMRRQYRCQIVRFMSLNPTASRQEVKLACESAFYWLYLHEHNWLDDALPVAHYKQCIYRVDWGQRDMELVVLLQKMFNKGHLYASRTELDRCLGGHGWLTSKIEKLPKTQVFLRKKGLFSSS